MPGENFSDLEMFALYSSIYNDQVVLVVKPEVVIECSQAITGAKDSNIVVTSTFNNLSPLTTVDTSILPRSFRTLIQEAR
jgi:hypothetical protein